MSNENDKSSSDSELARANLALARALERQNEIALRAHALNVYQQNLKSGRIPGTPESRGWEAMSFDRWMVHVGYVRPYPENLATPTFFIRKTEETK